MSKNNVLPFDLDLWPTTLTYNPSLAKVKVDPHAKYQGRRSNSSEVRAYTNKRTDGQTDGCYQTYYLPCFAVDNKLKFVLQLLVAFRERMIHPVLIWLPWHLPHERSATKKKVNGDQQGFFRWALFVKTCICEDLYLGKTPIKTKELTIQDRMNSAKK